MGLPQRRRSAARTAEGGGGGEVLDRMDGRFDKLKALRAV
jgi:hypothetical protein